MVRPFTSWLATRPCNDHDAVSLLIRVNWYRLHGVSIRVSGPDEITEGIGRRLLSFASGETREPDLDFRFTRGECLVDPPRGARAIYELAGGGVWYDAATDTITAQHSCGAQLRCDAAAGRAEYTLRAGEEASRVATHILFTLPLIELLRRRDLFNVHAAALCKDGAALLFGGASGAGKSTLTLAMTQAGWDYMADDMVFLRPGCAGVYGFPEGIDVFPECGSQSHKVHVRPEREVLEAAPRALIFPRVAHQARSVLHPISPAEALLRLAPDILLTNREVCEKHLQVLRDLTQRTPAFRMDTGTDLEELTQLWP